MANLLAVCLFVATCIATSHAYCAPGALLCQPVGGLGGFGELDALGHDLDLNLGLGLHHGLGLGPLARLNLLKKSSIGIIKPLLLKVPVPVAAAPQIAFLPAPLPVPAPAPVPPPAPLPRCGCIVPSCSCLTK